MKFFFSALVLINIGYFMWQSWYVETPGMLYGQPSGPDIVPEQMRMVSEIKGELKRRNRTSSTRTALKNVIPEGQCYRIGPFPREKQVMDVRRWVAHRAVTAVPKKVTHERNTYRVIVLSLSSPTAIANVRKKLTNMGFHDHASVTESADKNIVSAGVFAIKVNAEKRIKALKVKGITGKIQTLSGTQSHYWLDVNSKTDLSSLLSSQKWSVPQAKANAVECDSQPPGSIKQVKK